MLIYISSYPRSGNSWVRILVRHYLDRRSSSIYREESGDPNLVINQDGSFGPAFSEYSAQYPPIVTRKRLVNGCEPLLSDEFRQYLGESEECFFLKTHELPFREYFKGEVVIHLVRHPGAVFWSYYNFIKDNQPEMAPFLVMEDVIKGKVPFGSWSEYNERWLECGETLEDRFLLYSYEQLSEGEADFCEKVSSLTGLPVRREFGSFPKFDHWHRFAPKLFRSGQVDEWASHFSLSQLKLIELFHGPTMGKLSYELDQQLLNLKEANHTDLSKIIDEQNEEIARLREKIIRLQKRTELPTLPDNGKPDPDALLEMVQKQRHRLVELQTERDEVVRTLLIISRTRVYRLLKRLGRWKGIRIPE